MIVVDTSAIVAIFQNEEDALTYASAIETAENLTISAVNAHETAMILRARHGVEAEARFWHYLDVNGFEIAAFDRDQARMAADAFGRFGKGIHSKARLNLADCAAYALAKSMSAPLLYKGNDFSNTDVEPWH